MTAPFLSGLAPIATQFGLALAGIGGVALAPPATGTMMVVSWDGVPAGRTVTSSLTAGATLIGSGPVAGSIIVRGDRAQLRAALAGRRVLILAASASTCGA